VQVQRHVASGQAANDAPNPLAAGADGPVALCQATTGHRTADRRSVAAPAGWIEVMGDDPYPRLLVDRDVVVMRDDMPEQIRLRGWLDGYDGPVPTYRIELVARAGSYACPYTATGPDMFEALVRLRRQLEPDGLMVAVQGSRRDTFPSGMARDMGGGMQVYVLRPGRGARLEDLVGTLDDAPPDQMATVDEQQAFFDAWFDAPRRQRLWKR
jgi:hypothetical protein